MQDRCNQPRAERLRSGGGHKGAHITPDYRSEKLGQAAELVADILTDPDIPAEMRQTLKHLRDMVTLAAERHRRTASIGATPP